jgi:hypothetical protein
MGGLKHDFATIQYAHCPRQATLVSECPDYVSGLRTIHSLHPQRCVKSFCTPTMRLENPFERSHG